MDIQVADSMDTVSRMLGAGTPYTSSEPYTLSSEQVKSFDNMLNQAISLRSKITANQRLRESLNKEQFDRFEAVCNAAMGARNEFFSRFQAANGGQRNIDGECGYPSGIDVNGPWPYIELYRRDPIANRVIQLMPKEMFTVQPVVKEKGENDPENPSLFTQVLQSLQRLLHPEPSWYAGSNTGEGSYMMEYLQRVDTLSRVGTFGILLMGINDGRSLEQPVAGSVIYNARAKRYQWNDIVMSETGGFGDSCISPLDKQLISKSPIINAWDWDAKDHYGKFCPQPKRVNRTLSPYESYHLDNWEYEAQIVGLANQVFPGVTSPVIANQLNNLIINVLDAKAKYGQPLTREESAIFNKVTGFRSAYTPGFPTPLYYNPASGQYEQGQGANWGQGRARQADWPSQDPNYLNPSDLTGPGWSSMSSSAGPGYSSFGKMPNQGFTPAGLGSSRQVPGAGRTGPTGFGRHPSNLGTGPLGSITGYGPNGSAPPNNEGYSYKNSSTPGSQGSSPYQVRLPQDQGSVPPRWGKNGEQTEPPTGSEGWGNGAGAPPPWGQGPYQYGRSTGWGIYGQAGESGWASVGLPYGQLPNNPNDSGYAPSFANSDIPYAGFGAPPLNPGVPQPFGGQQYSSGYAVTPEGFAMTPGGPQAILPASILSGTDQQYYGVQFGPTELPAPGITPPHKLLFLRAYGEDLVQIVRYEWNIRNPRFGYPVMYRVTLNDPTTQHSGVGLPLATVFVHWSRVHHVADVHANATASEIFAIPVCQPILNRLIDLQKLYGGSAQMYWQGAFPGLAFETIPELGGDVDVDVEGTQRMMTEYAQGLRRYLTLVGMKVNSIAPQVVPPDVHIDKYLEAICIQIRWPKRKFIGAEQGQLASSQDEMDARRSVEERERNYGTPRLIVPFHDRLIKVGILPPPEEGYTVEWPERYAAADKDKSIISVGWIKALSQYYASGLAAFVPPFEFFTVFMKFTEEEALKIIESGEKWLKENMPVSELPGAPPEPVYGLPPAPNPGATGEGGAMGASNNPQGNGGQGSPTQGPFANPMDFFGHHGAEQREGSASDGGGAYIGNVGLEPTLAAYEAELKANYGDDITVNPFESTAQRAWMFANHPEMAKKWAAHTPKGKKLPRHKKKEVENEDASQDSPRVRDDDLLAANSSHLIPLPDVPQPNNYWCWPSAAMSVGLHWGTGPKKLKDWATTLGTTKENSTSPTVVAKYFQKCGNEVVARKNMTLAQLKAFVDKGWPVLVPIQEYMHSKVKAKGKGKTEYGHCVVVCGYTNGFLIVQDPSEDNVVRPKQSGSINAPGKALIDEQTFLKNWHDREWVRTGIAVGLPS